MADDVTGGQVLDPDAAENTVVAGAPGGGKEEKSDFKATDDGNLIEYGGRKYLREEAVHEARGKAAKYAETLQTLEPLMGEFEQFLASKQSGQRAAVNRATREAPESEYNDDELIGYAITRGYYDGDKPDLKRAKDDLDIMTAIADRRASKAVKPVADRSVRDRADENYERALNYRFPADGEPVAEERYVRAALDAIRQDSPEILADPKASELVQVIAAGLQTLDERKTGRRSARGSREPVFREGAGTRLNQGRGDELDALDRAAARARGKSPEQWAKLSKAVSGSDRGTGTVLEEI